MNGIGAKREQSPFLEQILRRFSPMMKLYWGQDCPLEVSSRFWAVSWSFLAIIQFES
jgi:hypothetical protein